MRVIIPSAGKGTRLNPSPDAPPKAMFPLAGRPLLEHVLEQTDFIAPEDTWIVVGYKGDVITSYFGDSYHYAWQREQLGTGHAVMQCAEDFRGYDGTVLVTFGDMPLFRRECMREMCIQHEAHHAACTLLTAENPELTMWARIVRGPDGRFQQIIEGKDCTPEQAQIQELFAGVLVFDSQNLFRLLPQLRNANVQQEYYLTEIPEMMAREGLLVETVPTADANDLRGINTPEDVEICRAILRQRQQ
ncbi:MAG: NTP transferase domain-containing protein [Victivallales bacterium]|nr:NTP transferase domain-containing protein [Victivallales bacterium]